MEMDKLTILYIDDEEINLRMFKSTFRRDFFILIACSAKEGLSILEKEPVDILITDQRMPEMTGVGLLREVALKFPHTRPVRMIISGYTADQDIEEAFTNYKLFRFIPKPWDETFLKNIILEASNTLEK
jgi:response regulator RpfG family c-di-GMP phosphodiesterase